MLKVAVLDDYQDVARAYGRWQDVPGGTVVTSLRNHVADPDRLAELLQGHEVVMAMRERTILSADLLRRLPDLRLLVTTGMSNEAIDMSAARALGVMVCGTESDGSAPAELTWALILSLARRLVEEDANVRRGGWQTTVGAGMTGRTLGLIGLGRIGQRVARVAAAFDMRVIAWSQNLTEDVALTAGAELVSKAELLATADVISLHLRLSDRTRGILAFREFSAMRRSALLVNTSRGALVEEDALLDALRRGLISGAAIDTFVDEPLPVDHPLRSLANTVLSPHLGYVTDQNYARFYGQAVEDVTAFLAGRPLRVLNDVPVSPSV